MAEQTFKSPGFFEREIEIISSTSTRGNRYTPYGVIGTAEKGPAFLPSTITSLNEFKKRFGRITDDMPAGHAVAEFFNNKASAAELTFTRVLGSGGPGGDSDFETKGTVPNAGFFVSGSFEGGSQSKMTLTINTDGVLQSDAALLRDGKTANIRLEDIAGESLTLHFHAGDANGTNEDNINLKRLDSTRNLFFAFGEVATLTLTVDNTASIDNRSLTITDKSGNSVTRVFQIETDAGLGTDYSDAANTEVIFIGDGAGGVAAANDIAAEIRLALGADIAAGRLSIEAPGGDGPNVELKMKAVGEILPADLADHASGDSISQLSILAAAAGGLTKTKEVLAQEISAGINGADIAANLTASANEAVVTIKQGEAGSAGNAARVDEQVQFQIDSFNVVAGTNGAGLGVGDLVITDSNNTNTLTISFVDGPDVVATPDGGNWTANVDIRDEQSATLTMTGGDKDAHFHNTTVITFNDGVRAYTINVDNTVTSAFNATNTRITNNNTIAMGVSDLADNLVDHLTHLRNIIDKLRDGTINVDAAHSNLGDGTLQGEIGAGYAGTARAAVDSVTVDNDGTNMSEDGGDERSFNRLQVVLDPGAAGNGATITNDQGDGDLPLGINNSAGSNARTKDQVKASVLSAINRATSDAGGTLKFRALSADLDGSTATGNNPDTIVIRHGRILHAAGVASQVNDPTTDTDWIRDVISVVDASLGTAVDADADPNSLRLLGEDGGSTLSTASGPFTGGGDTTTRAKGAVHFLVASHEINENELFTLGHFNDNDSITTDFRNDADGTAHDPVVDNVAELVRAMLFLEKDTHAFISATKTPLADDPTDDVVQLDDKGLSYLTFKTGGVYSTTYPISFDPSSPSYLTNVLNTDPYKLSEKGHYLYADFPVDSTIASVKADTSNVALVSGVSTKQTAGGDTTNSTANVYGRFETRYQAARTPKFISQPFGNKEYSLFHFEAIDDGRYPAGSYKASIRDLRASNDPNYKYGTFTVEIRELRDTDQDIKIIDKFTNCSLDPKSENYIAKLIGDQKIYLDLDVNSEDEKRLRLEGTFPNKSSVIRIVMSDDIMNEEVPAEALPFGFRGIPLLRTTSDGKDGRAGNTSFLVGMQDGPNEIFDPTGADNTSKLGLAVLPPVPYRFKVTKGKMIDDNPKTFLGEASDAEGVDSRLYWGAMTTRVSNITQPNNVSGAGFNTLFENYAKFLGIDKFGTMFDIDSADADKFNNNKFSLAKVAFKGSNVSDLGRPFDEFKEAVYVRNAEVNSALFDSADYKIKLNESNDALEDEQSGDTYATRATMASLLAEDTRKFNRYSEFAKFTATFFGGFDGLNIMDRDSYLMNDRSTSIDETNGKARTGGFPSGLATTDGLNPLQGTRSNNNIIMSYNNAIRLMTDPMLVNHNVLAIPGIKEPLIVDSAAAKVREYGKAIYLMDIPSYSSDGFRLFGLSETDGNSVPDVEQTSLLFNLRGIDNNYVASYFPEVYIVDSGYEVEGAEKLTQVPASVAAIGALAKTDGTGPWFAPAGFNRGGLSSTKATVVRLNSDDRDVLYEARINPISNFPNKQFVIFGQKTLQQAATSLDRVNVRRLVLEIKRSIEDIALNLLFSQNDAQTRSRFIERANSSLSGIRLAQGVEDFRVIMDDTNNSAEDVDNNRLNGTIIFVPTRAVEFIAMDFIITNSGVSFE